MLARVYMYAYLYVSMCVCVCECGRARVRARVCVCNEIIIVINNKYFNHPLNNNQQQYLSRPEYST